MKILSAEQIRKWDEFTILNEPVSSLDLMERAATKCVDWIENAGLLNRTFKIFCGKGNNGGDGLATARILAEKKVVSDVYVIESENLGSKDFEKNFGRLHSSPVRLHSINAAVFLPSINNDDIIVDALFGAGLNRTVEGLYADVIALINASSARV
ncbi:MAG TPA: NAD(P)H-hydrate epimerase, partial [Segetibacter sp.]